MSCGVCALRSRSRHRRLPDLTPEPVVALLMGCVGVAMDVMWDLLVFLALVGVGLVVLNLLARRR